MQRRLRWRPPAPIDLNEARLRVMFDALEQAREWLRQEALDPPVAEVWSGRPGEDLSAQYAFALGQVDLMVANALGGTVFGPGDMLDRVKRLRGLIDATLERCAREGHPASPPAERAEFVRAWAFRRARRQLRSLLHMTPGSGVVRRPSGLSR